MTAPRPYALLAEVTYRCPLHCPYCSNPLQQGSGSELTSPEWVRVLEEAAALGVLQVGFSGGEPLARPDLGELIAAARASGLFTNVLTSGVGLTPARLEELRSSGLDSIQLSLQADEADLADSIAGTRAHRIKLDATRLIKEAGLPLSLNVVLHRQNLDRLPQILSLAEELGAQRLELANTQYYGWAWKNRVHLLPTKTQVDIARAVADAAQKRLAGRMDIFYVLPDYYETRPKPCLAGWGRRYLTVNPLGDVLPCPTAFSIPGLALPNVRHHSLQWIWTESEAFNRFRGTAWMPEPCQSCDRREIDFGGCRCQAALLLGDATATDPVCTLSPRHQVVEDIVSSLQAPGPLPAWEMRTIQPGSSPSRR